jgi:hypothetical protein
LRVKGLWVRIRIWGVCGLGFGIYGFGLEFRVWGLRYGVRIEG